MVSVQLSPGYRATTTRQFPFYDSLPRFQGVSRTQLIILGRMKGWDDLGDTHWFRAWNIWIGNPVPLPLGHCMFQLATMRRKSFRHISQFGCEITPHIFFSLDVKLTLSTIKLNCSMHGFSYWEDSWESPSSCKFVNSLF